jgi:hypothetical protein
MTSCILTSGKTTQHPSGLLQATVQHPHLNASTYPFKTHTMKFFLFIGITLISLCSFAQSPQKMTFQAVVRNSGNALVTSGNVGFQFSILQGSPTGLAAYIETQSTVTNANGLATLVIGDGTPVAGSFASIDWSTGPYYLKCDTDPTGGTAYTVTSTTQLLSVPYALYAEDAGNIPTNVSAFTNDAGYITSPNDADSNPTNEIQSLSISGQTLSISGANSVTLPGSSGNTLDQSYDQGGAGAGRIITADAGAVEVNTAISNGVAVRAQNTNTGVAIVANGTSTANTFSTIQSTAAANSNQASAIIGNSTGAAWGVSGQVQSTATATAAVYGSNLRTNGGHGVSGIGFNGTVGETNYSMGYGVYGENYDAIAPLGDGVGVAGKGYYGVFGEDRYLGSVLGAYGVVSNGDFGATGAKSFMIDHPQDPANKILRHFSTESNEVLNIYRGNIVLDANGEATVEMPDYYDAININPSYHLTPIGGFAQLYVKEELNNGKFVIAGGTPGLKVSWTIYAERNDPYFQQFPEKRTVEYEKREGQKGLYFIPELYGAPNDLKILPTEDNLRATQPELNIQEQ